MMRWNGKTPLTTFKMRSKSERDVFWEVGLWGDGTLTCNCPVSMYKNKFCKHQKEIDEKLRSEFGGLMEAVDYYRQEIKKPSRGGEGT